MIGPINISLSSVLLEPGDVLFAHIFLFTPYARFASIFTPYASFANTFTPNIVRFARIFTPYARFARIFTP